ncbi:Transcription factor RfeF [Penicillium paradoxum]|uniref:Transcription factor RfeF n=1 Tax=Penicillium paradoxum TaxID=176176 RepID=UPI002547264A|nr:Transcription factor RfeF [Penicillium paradoxum]KAJ5772950.1 Transcription factor RfeF [Penicillium paradoxum]
MGFAQKIAAAQNSQTMANSGTYGGAPPSGYTGGPPSSLQAGGSVSHFISSLVPRRHLREKSANSSQSQQSQYQAYPGSPAPQGSSYNASPSPASYGRPPSQQPTPYPASQPQAYGRAPPPPPQGQPYASASSPYPGQRPGQGYASPSSPYPGQQPPQSPYPGQQPPQSPYPGQQQAPQGRHPTLLRELLTPVARAVLDRHLDHQADHRRATTDCSLPIAFDFHDPREEYPKFLPPERLDRLVQTLAAEAPGKLNKLIGEWAVPMEVATDVMKLALYDVILYVDDSGSIEFEEKGLRKDQLRQILGIVATAASTFDQDGISVRFMNSSEQGDGIRDAEDVERLVSRVRFSGLTPLGTSLRSKVVEPMIVQPARANRLEKPVLVITITDGQPAGESHGTVGDVIRYAVEETTRTRYGPGAVAFQFSQVGTDSRARDFLSSLDEDPHIGHLIDCTSNFEVEQDEMSRANPPVHLTRELWCAKLMLGAIDSSYDTKDERDNARRAAPPPSSVAQYGSGGGYGQPPQSQGQAQPPYGAPPGAPPSQYGSQSGYAPQGGQYAPPAGPPPGQAPQGGQYAPPAGPPPGQAPQGGQYAPPSGPPPGQAPYQGSGSYGRPPPQQPYGSGSGYQQPPYGQQPRY